MKQATRATPLIQSLDRGLFILEAVAKSSAPVALGDLTDLMGIDRTSVFRLANTLKRRGFLTSPNGRKDYVLGSSIRELAKQCARLKTDGYVVGDGEYREDVRCLAAPIRDRNGVVVASIGISAPVTRMPQELVRASASRVCEVARAITADLTNASV